MGKEKLRSQQSLQDQAKHLQHQIEDLHTQLKNANNAKAMEIAEVKKRTNDEWNRALGNCLQLPIGTGSGTGEPPAKRQKMDSDGIQMTESLEAEILKLKNQIKYLERKAHCLESEVDTKDDVISGFREEAAENALEASRLKEELEALKLDQLELEKEVQHLKKTRDVLTESINNTTKMSETALEVIIPIIYFSVNLEIITVFP